MKIKEPTRKHEIPAAGESWMKKEMRKPFRVLFWILVVCMGFALVSWLIVPVGTGDTQHKLPNKPAVSEKRIATSSRRQEAPPRGERPAVPVVEEKTTEDKSKSVESFPIEEMGVLKNSSSVWSLVGTVRNNTEHPVRGIVIIRFLDKTGHVFHESQNIVAGPKGITAIQTGEIPLLPEPEWIRPGGFGWFTHPEEYIVFEEAADIEVTFKKISK